MSEGSFNPGIPKTAAELGIQVLHLSLDENGREVETPEPNNTPAMQFVCHVVQIAKKFLEYSFVRSIYALIAKRAHQLHPDLPSLTADEAMNYVCDYFNEDFPIIYIDDTLGPKIYGMHTRREDGTDLAISLAGEICVDAGYTLDGYDYSGLDEVIDTPVGLGRKKRNEVGEWTGESGEALEMTLFGENGIVYFRSTELGERIGEPYYMDAVTKWCKPIQPQSVLDFVDLNWEGDITTIFPFSLRPFGDIHLRHFTFMRVGTPELLDSLSRDPSPNAEDMGIDLDAPPFSPIISPGPPEDSNDDAMDI